MLGLFWGERSGRGSDRGRLGRAERRGRATRRNHRPALEGLEERIVLATDVWSGGATNSNWTTAANWVGATAPVPGDDLVFPATGTLAPNNDFPSGTAFRSITIQGAGYNITGNPLSLTSGITASYTTGTSTYSITNTALTAVVAPIAVATGGTLDLPTQAVLSGTAGLNVTGGGILNLAGSNTYTGPTTLGSGTALVVNGTVVAGVQNSGGTLLGNGSVGSVNSVGGTIFPGIPPSGMNNPFTPGQLTANGSVTLDSASTFAALLDGTSPGNGVTGYSQLRATSGVVSLGGATLFVGAGTSYTPQVGNQLAIILNNTGAAINGNFANLAEGGAVNFGNSLFRISYLGTNGNGHDVVLSAVAAASSTTLLPVQLPTGPNQPITLTAQVTGSQGTPTGIVEFFNGSPTAGGSIIATAPLGAVNSSTATATATVASLGTGSSTAIYALYVPTPTTFTYAGSTSAPITFGTTTTLTSSSPIAAIGQPVTFTATVAPSSAGAGTPTGSVEFIADTNTVLGTVPLNSATGQASLTISSLSIGTHTIVAQFLANAPFQNSSSSALTQAISSSGTTPTLTVVPVRGRAGKVARFDLVAQVQPTLAGTGTPTGTVTFFINGRASYQSVFLSAGTAVLPVLTQRLENQYVYVRYNGTQAFIGSASKNFFISRHRLQQLAKSGSSYGPLQAVRQGRERHSGKSR